MNRVEEAIECFCRGAACSQAIVGAYGPSFGLPREQAMKLAAGFAGGMRMAQTCGAATGAFMVLGLRFGGPDCDQRDRREDVYAAIRQFTVRFHERNHTLICKDLLGCDISTPEGSRQASTQGLFRTICPRLVQDAAEILEELL